MTGLKQGKQGSFIAAFLKMEASGGILLMLSAVLAMVLVNTAFGDLYRAFLTTPVEVRIGQLDIDKPLLLWINDGLMAIFFFLVGLELKRELLEGELSDKRNVILPGVGAIGGMLVPAQAPTCHLAWGRSNRWHVGACAGVRTESSC